MKTEPNDPSTGKDLNELFKDEEAVVSAYEAFNRHISGSLESLNSFRESLRDPETVSVINAMMLACQKLSEAGYAPK